MAVTPLELVATGVLAIGLALITIVDLRSLIIPDKASLGLIALGLALSVWSPAITPREALWGTLVGYATFAGIGEIYFRRFGQEGLGLGDAKLLAAAGAWLGWAQLPTLVAMAGLTAIAFAAITRARQIAFGPWLSMAFWILWVAQISGASASLS